MKQLSVLILLLCVTLTGYAQRNKKTRGDKDMPYIESVRGDERTQFMADKLIPEGDTSKISQFIAAGINPNGIADYTNGITLLNKALRWYSLATVECLLRNGADPNLRARQTNRAMFSDAISYSFGRYPLEAAADANSIEKMQLLVKYGADISRCIDKLSKIASSKGNTEMMAYLGKATGGSVVSKDALAVMTEHSYEHDVSKVTPELIHQLVQDGADVNAHGSHGGTALINVINNDQIRNKQVLATALIKEGANVNIPDREDPSRLYLGFYPTSPLKAAIKQGNLEMVKLLVESGANVNQADGGNSPLKSANDSKIKEYLILKGAK